MYSRPMVSCSIGFLIVVAEDPLRLGIGCRRAPARQLN